MRRWAVAVIAVLGTTLGASGCSGGDDGDVITSDGDGVEVTVTISDDSTDPSGAVVRVEEGEDITVRVTSDVDDVVHIHSEPDHSIPVTAGQETVETFSIDSPGTFEMESHRLETVIAKIEVG